VYQSLTLLQAEMANIKRAEMAFAAMATSSNRMMLSSLLVQCVLQQMMINNTLFGQDC
jgi:hypothetical protein